MEAWGFFGRSGRRRRGEDILQLCRRTLVEVNALEARMRACSDGELRGLTDVYRARREPLDVLLPAAFATVREVARRALAVRVRDEQILGGVALTVPALAEMRSGEGKTLTCVLAAYLSALTGKGVHVMTVSDQLAQRDAGWMGPIYRRLGLDSGVIQPGMEPDERRSAYRADVTYGTAEEFGYDLLRDNMAWSTDECVQRGHGSAIVDGADVQLIENGRLQMIISGRQSGAPSHWYAEFARFAAMLDPGDDYEVDTTAGTVVLLQTGVRKVEERLGVDNLYDSSGAELLGFLHDAVKAKELYRKGQEYIVEDEHVFLVDEIAGEVVRGRYGGNIHHALGAKEGVPIRPQIPRLAEITVHGLLREYGLLAGVTAAAPADHREAYLRIYGLPVVTIPTYRPTIRIDHPDVVYETEDEQLAAVVAEVADRNAAQQPVLVDTVPLDRAERLSRLLDDRCIEHRLLKADGDAAAMADAGRPGAVTVATQHAGRSANIVLGGATAAERELVVQRGGLYVVGTERFARHRDEQVRAQAGRYGDPGESRFILCRRDRHPLAINVSARQQGHQRDAVTDEQRRLVYAERGRILSGVGLREQVRHGINEVIDGCVASYLDAHVLWESLRKLYPISISVDEIIAAPGQAAVTMLIKADAHLAYDRRERDLGHEVMRELERRVLLSVIDRLWREHLAAMDDLFDRINLHPIGTRDPLAEYRREGARLFAAMTTDIWVESIGYLHNLEVEVEDTS